MIGHEGDLLAGQGREGVELFVLAIAQTVKGGEGPIRGRLVVTFDLEPLGLHLVGVGDVIIRGSSNRHFENTSMVAAVVRVFLRNQ